MNVNTLVTKKGFQSYTSLHCKENYVPKLIFKIKLGIVMTIMNSNSVWNLAIYFVLLYLL